MAFICVERRESRLFQVCLVPGVLVPSRLEKRDNRANEERYKSSQGGKTRVSGGGGKTAGHERRISMSDAFTDTHGRSRIGNVCYTRLPKPAKMAQAPL